MRWKTRAFQAALLAAALGLGAGEASAQDGHPARPTLTRKRITHDDRKAVAVHRAELQRRAEAEQARAAEALPADSMPSRTRAREEETKR